MNNPVWEWLVKSKLSAYAATEKFNAPSAFDAGPGWCFDRFGQTSTSLVDGRVVLIGGEHEDFYDPDFYIYNDVVIRHPDGKIDIFGYPRDVFPPTDFHTATLVGNRIIIIGCLGYQDERRAGITPILVLDIDTLAISQAVASGTPPGWIHRHDASVSEDGSSILIRNGKLDRGIKGESLVENLDEWRLHLGDWRWERLTDRQWQRWEFVRSDRKHNHFWRIRLALFYHEVNLQKELQEQMEELALECGTKPNLELIAELYRPAIPYEQIPNNESEHGVIRIKVNGITVRYVEEMQSIQMTVEGDLPQHTIDALKSDLLNKLTNLEGTSYEVKQL